MLRIIEDIAISDRTGEDLESELLDPKLEMQTAFLR